jgi:hypothetical protein
MKAGYSSRIRASNFWLNIPGRLLTAGFGLQESACEAILLDCSNRHCFLHRGMRNHATFFCAEDGNGAASVWRDECRDNYLRRDAGYGLATAAGAG